MLYKICGRCGSRVGVTSKCKCVKKKDKGYDRFQRDKERTAFYHSKRWTVLTKLCKSKCNGLDLYEYYINGRVVKGELSHHIIPVEDDITKAYDLDNLIYVSQRTHNIIHAAYDKSIEDKNKMQGVLVGIVERAGAGY